MNKVILIGNLVRDVELSTTPSGVSVAKFTLAVNRTFTNSEGEREADYPNIIAWRDLADRCAQYLSKGKKAAVVGMLQTRSYEVEGQKRYVTEVVASEVEFLTPKGESQQAAPQGYAPRGGAQRQQRNRRDDLVPIDDDGNLPF